MSEEKLYGEGSPQKAPYTKDFWPQLLDLRVLAQNNNKRDPLGEGFNYREAFEALDLEAVKADIAELLTTEQEWWPADFGNYGPFFVRMAWHSAGTYRAMDGRGGDTHGQQRFEPLNSWPDNVSLDKARRLVWPIKKKYGRALSWGDLMALAGTVAQEQMGLPVVGFAGGRTDEWESDRSVYWGAEGEMLGRAERTGSSADKLEKPLGATHMGLIYVNPEGPGGKGDPRGSAAEIKETFHRMGMKDEEIVALIAGGHTFGKGHGAANPEKYVGPDPSSSPMAQQGLGWKSSYKSGKGADTIGGGPELVWTQHPTRWDNEFFHNLLDYEWEQETAPSGFVQWVAKGDHDGEMPNPDGVGGRRPGMMTSDIALREDPEFRAIAERFRDDFDAFTSAYARAWFKLTTRSVGPRSRWLGADVPAEIYDWEDYLPAHEGELITADDADAIKQLVAASGLSVQQLVKAAFAAVGSFRGSDNRGGANGGRIRLEPQRSWAVNDPANLEAVIPVLEKIVDEFNAGSPRKVSFADVVVLAGNWAVEQAAKAAGVEVSVPFAPGRVDATAEMTDQMNMEVLEPRADAFRNYVAEGETIPAEYLLVDRAQLLTLTVPEMTVLLAGMRELGANWDGSDAGVFTDRVGVLSTDWFTNLLDMRYEWNANDESETTFTARDRGSGEEVFHGTRADLVFGSNAELRAIAEVYASDDAAEKFVLDFVKVWVKLANADRFDLK